MMHSSFGPLITQSYLSERTTRPITISSVFSSPPRKLNGDVFEMHNLTAEPNVEVIFFHDFELGDSRESYWRDWTSGDKSQCWPQSWLPEEFPRARVLSVSYDSSLAHGRADIAGIAEKLVLSLIRNAQVGRSGCPVVLVGHGVGGLVLKKLCVVAQSELNSDGDSAPLESFLNHLQGMFFYATPHRGSAFFSQMRRAGMRGPLLEDMNFPNEETALLNEDFSRLRFKYRWNVCGAGELHPTKLGRFQGMVVEEASARHGMLESYVSIFADHVGVNKPAGKTATSFQIFLSFITNILRQERIFTSDETADPDEWFVDPITYGLMFDPVKCTDGRTYNRWTIIDGNIDIVPCDRNMKSFRIAFDDIDVKRRLFRDFPAQKKLCMERRETYRRKALQHAYFLEVNLGKIALSNAQKKLCKSVIMQLDNVLHWAASDAECRNVLERLQNLLDGVSLIPLTVAQGRHTLPISEIVEVDDGIPVLENRDTAVGPVLVGIFVCCLLFSVVFIWVFSKGAEYSRSNYYDVRTRNMTKDGMSYN